MSLCSLNYTHCSVIFTEKMMNFLTEETLGSRATMIHHLVAKYYIN